MSGRRAAGLWARLTSSGGDPPRPAPACEFCGRLSPAFKKLVRGPGIGICNDCIELAARAVGTGEGQADGRASFELPDRGADARCSFCGKRRRDVDQVAVSPAGAICDQCIKLCLTVLAEGERR